MDTFLSSTNNNWLSGTTEVEVEEVEDEYVPQHFMNILLEVLNYLSIVKNNNNEPK